MTNDHIRGFLILSLILLPLVSQCQPYADTLPSNKNAVIEEFTGVKCPYCPAGHDTLNSLINEHPGRIFPIAMHPANTSLTAPYTGNPDFRRSYLNAFFSIPFATDSVRFMPGAFINRRLWLDGRREQSTEKWRKYADTILSEPSPVNIGLHSVYDLAAKNLTVAVEVFYTDTLQDPQTLFVFLTEDSLIAQQNNGGVNYIHNHVFRESLVAQWGDTVISSGLPGTLYAANFNYNNSTTLYYMQRCHVIAALRDAATEEIITGNWELVNDIVTSNPPEARRNANVLIYPNPSQGIFHVEIPGKPSEATFSIYDMTGRLVKTYTAFKDQMKIDLSGEPLGIYYGLIMTGDRMHRFCLVKL